MSTGVEGITEADIADYLANTPEFFERHAQLLATVQLVSPHGQRAVSLQERQMEMLRDRIKGLEQRLIEMLRHGQDNVAIADRLHRWTRALMLTADAAELPEALLGRLLQLFMIPQGGLRLWGVAPEFGGLACAQRVDDDVKSFAASLSEPYCGINTGFEAARWLEQPAAALSLALIPLRAADDAAGTFGLLVLASPDPTRYSAGMGVDFLTRIGDIAGAALARLLPRAAGG